MDQYCLYKNHDFRRAKDDCTHKMNERYISWSKSPLKMHFQVKEEKRKKGKALYRILDFSQQLQLPDYIIATIW